MDFVIHRVNAIETLKTISPEYGVEIDLRAEGSRLVLNHDPYLGGTSFVDYLDAYCHGLLVLNIKETGIENDVLKLVRQKGIREFFLLDVEFPFIYHASRQGERAIALRYSEDEPIETALLYEGKVDWLWIDTNTRLPLTNEIVRSAQTFRTCLVCPERWGRPNDILPYARKMRGLQFCPNAVMTAIEQVPQWEAVTHLLNDHVGDGRC